MSKYLPGDKFEIEIEKVLVDDIVDSVYKIKGFKTLVFDDNGIRKLEREQDKTHPFRVGEVVDVFIEDEIPRRGIINALEDNCVSVIDRNGNVIIARYEEISFAGRYTGLTDWLKDNIQDNSDEIPF